MSTYLIINARLVNENKITDVDILIKNGRIAKIAPTIDIVHGATVIDAKGNFVLPGVIDDQVHFREPGLTHKANIASESAAAIAGGITTFFEQPNTQPQTTTLERLEEKFNIAQQTSFANYSFFLGGTNDNLEELKRLDKNACAGVKLFWARQQEICWLTMKRLSKLSLAISTASLLHIAKMNKPFVKI